MSRGAIQVRRDEKTAAHALLTQFGHNLLRDVREGRVAGVDCIVEIGSGQDEIFLVHVDALIVAKEGCSIRVDNEDGVQKLADGGIKLIPAGIRFQCSQSVENFVFVPWETFLTLQYDVITDREAETGMAWDHLEGRGAGLADGRSRKRWTIEEDER